MTMFPFCLLRFVLFSFSLAILATECTFKVFAEVDRAIGRNSSTERSSEKTDRVRGCGKMDITEGLKRMDGADTVWGKCQKDWESVSYR